VSFTVDLIVDALPSSSKLAWAKIETLRMSYHDDKRERAAALIALHSVLTARYPCLSSYSDDDPEAEECPWADGPMIGNFAHEMGMLAILSSRADELVPFIIKEANALGITVADGQSGKIHRPGTIKPRWKFWL
jgi:hypothetical protein